MNARNRSPLELQHRLSGWQRRGGEAEISEMMEVAAERSSAQYTAFDVNFEINRYNYTDEKSSCWIKLAQRTPLIYFMPVPWNTSAWQNKGGLFL